MDFFTVSVGGAIGACSAASTILISIRKCYKAHKKIGPLVADGVALLKNIEDLAQRSTVFLDIGAIDKMDFCAIVRKTDRIKDGLEEVKSRLKIKDEDVGENLKRKFMNQIVKFYRLPSRTESAAETEMRWMVTAVRTEAKTSLVIEMMRQNDGFRASPSLENVHLALRTNVLVSRLNRVASGDAPSPEGVLNLNMGKMYLEGLTVTVDYKKSASFFLAAIRCGILEAFG